MGADRTERRVPGFPDLELAMAAVRFAKSRRHQRNKITDGWGDRDERIALQHFHLIYAAHHAGEKLELPT